MFKLETEIVLTKPVVKDAEPVLFEAMKEIKAKLASQGNEFDYSFSAKKDLIALSVSSKNMASCNNVILPFEKQAAAALGKKLKVGIKEVVVKSYEVDFVLEAAPKKDVTVPFASSVSFKGTSGVLRYADISFQFIKNNNVDRTVKLLKDKIKMANYEGKDEFREIVWSGKERNIDYKNDPSIELEKINWIRRSSGKGQFVYGREFTALMNVFKDLLVENVYSPLGFSEMVFPKFEPWDVPKKSGHAKNIYPNAYFVFTPNNASPEFWEDAIDKFAITGEVQIDLVKEKSTSVGIMSYAQCPPFWPYLEGKIIDENTLPLKVFDWSGPTYRNESGGTHGLDRIEEFHRIEVLFVGTQAQVIQVWKDLNKAYINFFDKVLDVEARASSVTPWWMAHAGIRDKSDLADVGTYDFDVYLPFRGARDREWLEVQNNSANGEKYPVAFNVKSNEQKHLWSGCSGASLQRYIVAFLAQKGLDSKNWPAAVRKPFEEKLKAIKPLKFY